MKHFYKTHIHIVRTTLFVLALFLFAAPAHAAITDGLVGHWTFDDGSGTTANDSSSGNNDGTLTNMDGATDWVTGRLGGALDFDGTNDHITLPNGSVPAAPRTVSMWMRSDDVSKSQGLLDVGPVSGCNPSGQVFGIGVYSNPPKLTYQTGCGVNQSSSNNLTTGQWHHVAVVLAAVTDSKLYMDGMLVSSSTNTTGGRTIAAPNNALIGSIWLSGVKGLFFDGLIDDVRVYNRTLTQQEITTLANLHIPDITTTSLPDGTVSPVAYSQTLGLLGGNGPYTWATTTGNLPPGLSLNPSTGAITGQATATGTYPFTIEVEDDRGETDTQALSITIIIPVVTTNSLPNGGLGVAYSETLQAAGGTTPYTWAVTSGALPAGLSLNPTTGAITGTPTTAGTYAFTVEVTDDLDGTDDQELSIIVTEDPAITTTSLPDGTIDTAYAQTLAVANGTSPYTWSISSGSLPNGLSLDADTGEISGTPSVAGTASFTVRVEDDNGIADTQALSITVNAEPIITTTSLPGGTEGSAYSHTLSASGGTAPFTWSVTSGALPGGLSLNTSTGAITGTPTADGTFTFTVQVADTNGAADTQDLSIIINEPRSSSSGGGSVQGQVKNLLEMGKTDAAQELMKKWPHLFPGVSSVPITTASTPGTCPTYTFTRNLRQGDEGEDVRALQQLLNCFGFALAESGPGAPGEETILFRDRTHDAVARFQETYAADILAPLGLTKGTGYFAELTRKKAGELLGAININR